MINRNNVNTLLRVQFYYDKVIIKQGYKISHKQKYRKINLIHFITLY